MFVEIIINRRDADLTAAQFDTIRQAVRGFVKESGLFVDRGAMLTRDTAYLEQVETELPLEDIAKELRECLPIIVEMTHTWNCCSADDSASGTAFICLELDD